jgi:hypothetical protein
METVAKKLRKAADEGLFNTFMGDPLFLLSRARCLRSACVSSVAKTTGGGKAPAS